MSNPSLEQALQTALAHHQAGQLAQAELIYRQILNASPLQPQALHLLGVIANQNGHFDRAIDLITQAVALAPNASVFHSNLGNAYGSLGRWEEAVACYRKAITLQPEYVDAHFNLGIAYEHISHFDQARAAFNRTLACNPAYAPAHHNLGTLQQKAGEWTDARASFQRAIALQPDCAEYHCHLGVTLESLGQFDAAAASQKQALTLRFDYPEAHYNLGTVLHKQGHFTEAAACYQRAISLLPSFAAAHDNLGLVLQRQGFLEEAIASSRRALAIEPNSAISHYNLGLSLSELGRVDEAEASYRHALMLRPEAAPVLNNLGNILKDQGYLDEALATYQKADRIQPEHPLPLSNRVYTLHFHSDSTAQTLYREHLLWAKRHGEPRRQFILPHHNIPRPERRLKIGYVSPNLRLHVVGRFLLPLLEAHDRSHYEIFCYSDTGKPDAHTDRIRACTDHWRDTENFTEEQLTETIRHDGIDILVDLALHMAGNRLPVFARKPAPVQVTYLAYAGTSGLDTIGYRLSDPYLDPVGSNESVYSEKTWRLPETYWCYPQPENSPPVSPLPALKRGYITFGCLNNFCKVSPKAFALWTRLLQTVADSRLVLHIDAGSVKQRQHIQASLANQGIASHRVEFTDFEPLPIYFNRYLQIDISLDPFPYTGGTTTCDALWMGVPVITLSGSTAVGRGGVSILTNIGLPELVAQDEEDYLQIAANLASNLPRLANLRSGLRERMQASTLMDAPRFARNVETAYRWMWKSWCANT